MPRVVSAISAVNPMWNDGVGQSDWESDAWWENKIGIQTPSISNSVIASHPRCKGLKTYKAMIRSNFKALKSDGARRELYSCDVRTSTIRMTRLTAASQGSGFSKAGQERNASFMRGNWYFPMYLVVDRYFHDWF